MAKIKMYTTSWCGDCRMAKMLLAEKGISYEEIDIETTPGAAEIVMQANDGRDTQRAGQNSRVVRPAPGICGEPTNARPVELRDD